MFRKIRKFIRLSRNEKVLFREALFSIYFCKLYLLLFSFKRATRRFSSVIESSDYNRSELDQIKIAIRRAAKLTFWRNKCLVETFAARKMLNKRQIPSLAFLGLKNNDTSELKAHAWITVDEVFIVPCDTTYRQIFSF